MTESYTPALYNEGKVDDYLYKSKLKALEGGTATGDVWENMRLYVEITVADKNKGAVTVNGTGLYGGSVTTKFTIQSKDVNKR